MRREAEAAAEGADLRTNIAGAEGEEDEAAGGAPEPYSVLPSAEEAKAGEQPALARWSGVAQMAWPHTPLDAAGLGRLQLKQAARGIELPTWIPPATLAGVCKNRIGYPNQRQGERQAGGVAQGQSPPWALPAKIHRK